MFSSTVTHSQDRVIKDKLDEIEKMNDDALRFEILDWISKVPFEDHHLFICRSRQVGTGNWLLKKNDFENWRNSRFSSILWLHGIAGAGKTTLASFIIDESMESKNDAVAYFYCKHGERDRQDPESILSTIVKQLSLMSPAESLPKSVISIFKEQKEKAGKMPLSESQELIASLAENFVQTIIVIDALDECDKESRQELLAALDVILDSSKAVIKFFVTSRDADDIALKLENVPNVYINSSDNTADIAAFVRAEVEKCISQKSLLRESVTSEVKESIVEKLIHGANGMFLWVSLQIKNICEAKTPMTIEEFLQHLPETLKDTYSVIWGKIYDQIADNRTLAENTLKWIMCAQSPLAAEEILQAVSIYQMDFTGNKDRQGLQVQDLLDVCQNLIVMDEQLRVLRTAHFSVNEFLEEHFKITEAHSHAAEVCFTLMRRPKIYDKPPMPSISNGGIERYSFPILTPRPKFYDEPNPLRYYMFDHWAYHIRFSGNASNSLLELQKEFFNASPAYYAWLEQAEERWDLFRPMQGEVKLTPCWVAAYYQLWDIFKNLLRANVNDYNIRNVHGTTPLLLAAGFGNGEVVKLLSKRGLWT